ASGSIARPPAKRRTVGGETFKDGAGALVRAVLAPHHGEHSHLGEVRFPAQEGDDLLVLLLRQPMLGDEVFDARTHVVARAGFRAFTASSSESRSSCPSSLPRRASAQRSG